MLCFMGFFHIRVVPSVFRCSMGTFSKKPFFASVGRLEQLWFSVGYSERKRFSVGNIQTKTSFYG